MIWFLVFNATFSNISAISWRPVLVVEEEFWSKSMQNTILVKFGVNYNAGQSRRRLQFWWILMWATILVKVGVEYNSDQIRRRVQFWSKSALRRTVYGHICGRYNSDRCRFVKFELLCINIVSRICELNIVYKNKYKLYNHITYHML